MKRRLLFTFATLLALLPYVGLAATTTWSFEWNTSKKDGGQGFYNFGSSKVEKDVYTTELNGVQWNISSEGTYIYAYTSTMGQYIGSASEAPSSSTLWTTGFAGKIKDVKVTARVKDDKKAGNVAVAVNGKDYLCDGKAKASLTGTLAEYAFTINDADMQEGKLEIKLNQTSEEKGPLYIYKVVVDYEVATSGVPAPVFTPAAGTYDKAQQVAIATEGLDAGTYTIYYTTDGSNPRLADGTRKAYTEPIDIAETTTLKAIVAKGEEQSEVAEANYVIRKNPQIKFNEKEITLLSGDEGYSDLLNPNKLSPITYKSSNWMVCSVDKYGALSSSYVKEDSKAIITATFAGDDTYYPLTDTLTVYVKARTPLKTPEVTPLGGTFSEPVEVKITTDDENAVTIWYSTNAKSAEEFEESDNTQSVVVEGHEATVTIDKSCTLYVMTRGYNVNSEVISAEYTINLPLKADFTTDRASVAYYDQEFDSPEEVEDWTVGNGWKLSDKKFKSINANDKYSAFVSYEGGSGTTQLASPELTVKEGSKVEFYAYFAPNFLIYGKWTFNITDVETNQSETLLDAFSWAQETAYNATNWNKFSFDLAAYAGKKVTFSFDYPFGGEDLAIDGFRLVQDDPTAKDAIHIFEGEEIAFKNLSEGEPKAYEWAFPGADTETSTEENPVVRYSKAGTYNVSLTIKRGEESNKVERTNFVVVTKKAPTAKIGLPEEGYESPYVGTFIPLDVPVTFRDLSEGNPTEWKWVFQNTDKTESNEQNPTVTYTKAGTVSVGLTAKNDAGQTNDILQWAIQAGGAQNVWNISLDENSDLKQVNLGYYGYYGGTNWLGMEKFAELYKAPLADATVDSASVFFASVGTIDPEKEITMTMNAVAENGEPGEVMATATKKAGELQYRDDDYLATIFHFDKTVELKKGTPFFIVIGPFPNGTMEESPYTADDISIFCHRRNPGEKTTTWHYLAEEDANYQPTGEYKWYENSDDPLSMAIAPVISYATTSTAINNRGINTTTSAHAVATYTLGGAKVQAPQRGGIYIVKYSDGTSRKMVVK